LQDFHQKLKDETSSSNLDDKATFSDESIFDTWVSDYDSLVGDVGEVIEKLSFVKYNLRYFLR